MKALFSISKNKKHKHASGNYAFISSFIVTFTVISMVVLWPVLNRKEDIEEVLTGSINRDVVAVGDPPPSGGTIDGDMVYWENDYARLEVTPHTSNGIITQTQYADITWKYPDNNIDIAFRFDEPLSGKKDIWLWQNISHNVKVSDYGDKAYNFTLVNISDFQVLSEQTYVDFGDNSSLHYAQGTASHYDEMEWVNGTFIIGFDSFEWLSSESANFTYHHYGVIGNHMEEQHWFDWSKKTHLFQHTTHNDKEYYYLTNIPVKQNHNYKVKWQYDVPIHGSGKWELMAKLSSETISEALNSGHYIMLDPWWNSSWSYYKTITIDPAFVDNTCDNFPMLVVIDSATGAKCDGGNSIRFLKTDNSTELAYEIDEWNIGSNSYVWINISSVDENEDTVILMYYNNSGASDNQNPTGTWNNNYYMVQHMQGASYSALDDSTSNNIDATSDSGSPTYSATGKIGDCVTFDGINDYIKNSGFSIDTGSSQTHMCWIKFPDLDQERRIFYETDYNYVVSSGWRMDNPSAADTDNIFQGYTLTTNTHGTVYTNRDYASASTWYFVVCTVNPDTQNINLYIDGVNHSDNVVAFSGTLLSDTGLNLGCHRNEGRFMEGEIDEFRFCKSVLNESWIELEFHSQNQSTGLITFGSEQTYSAPGNNNPVNSAPVPTNSSTSQELNLQLSITVNDADDTTQNMNVSWYWGTDTTCPNLFGRNESVNNGTYSRVNGANFSSYSTLYYWKIVTNDGNGGWDNDTYHFTTVSKTWQDTFSYLYSFSNDSVSTKDTFSYIYSFSNTSAYSDSSYIYSFSNDTVSNKDMFSYLYSFSNDSVLTKDVFSYLYSFSNSSITNDVFSYLYSFSNSSSTYDAFSYLYSFSNDTVTWQDPFSYVFSFSNDTISTNDVFSYVYSFSNTSAYSDASYIYSFSNTSNTRDTFSYLYSFSNDSVASKDIASYLYSFSNTSITNDIFSYIYSFSNTSSHAILEPSFETVTNWTYYESHANCDGGQSASGVTDGSKSYGLEVSTSVGTGYCKVYQERINLTNIDRIYTDIYINSDAPVDVHAYASIRVNDDIIWERKIGQMETILCRNISINVESYNDYCTLEYRLNQTDIFYDEGIFIYIDNIRTSIWHDVFSYVFSFSNDTVSTKDISSYIYSFSNDTVTTKDLLSYLYSFSNTSISTDPFSYVFSFSNSSTTDDIFSYIYSFSNDSISTKDIFSYIFSFSNTSTTQDIFSCVYSFSNASTTDDIFSYVYSFSNDTVSSKDVLSYLFSFSNDSVTTNDVFSYLYSFSNTSSSSDSFSYLYSFSNTSSTLDIARYIYSFSNSTLGPFLGTPTPSNGSTIYSTTYTWSVLINDTYGTFNWTINCTNGQNNSHNSDINGTKTLNLTSLNYTSHTVWVNVSDTEGYSINEWFTFIVSEGNVTGDFDYYREGQTVIVTPELGDAVDYFKWEVENGETGDTGWIPADEIDTRIWTFDWNQLYKITLLFKNETLSGLYSDTINIPQDPSYKPPVITPPDVEVPKFKKIVPEGVRNWLGERSQLELFALFAPFVILFLFLARKKRKKIFIKVDKSVGGKDEKRNKK